MKKLFEKYREIILYLVFGVLTTLVSWAVYFGILYFAEYILKIERNSIIRVIAQVYQWVAGVLVAFFTNKKWVFNTKGKTMQELSKFAVGRIGTLGLDTLFTFGTVALLEALGYVPFTFIVEFTPDLWSKIVASVVVIITNYVISKIFVFKKAK